MRAGGALTTSRPRCIYSYFSVFAFFQNITFLLYYNVERISPGSTGIFHPDVGRSIFIASSKFPARSNFKTGRLRQVTCVISLYICGCKRHSKKIAASLIQDNTGFDPKCVGFHKLGRLLWA